MTGSRLYKQVLGYDFDDYRKKHFHNSHNPNTRRWTKKVRRYIEKISLSEVEEHYLIGYDEE